MKDSFMALKQAAAFYRQQLNIRVVGITGSVGKNSTKEFVASVLSEKYKVHKTAGNYNNEVGLPLTIFGIQEDDQIAVLRWASTLLARCTVSVRWQNRISCHDEYRSVPSGKSYRQRRHSFGPSQRSLIL